MDTEKSQNLQSLGKLESMAHFQFKNQRAGDPRRADVSVECKGRKRLMTQLKAVRQEEFSLIQPFLLYSDLWLIR